MHSTGSELVLNTLYTAPLHKPGPLSRGLTSYKLGSLSHGLTSHNPGPLSHGLTPHADDALRVLSWEQKN